MRILGDEFAELFKSGHLVSDSDPQGGETTRSRVIGQQHPPATGRSPTTHVH